MSETDPDTSRLRDDIAKRDVIIDRQAKEIVILRQKIDALCRKYYGVSSEKVTPEQLEFLFNTLLEKEAAAEVDDRPAPSSDIPNHNKRSKKSRAPRIPENLPCERQEIIPAEVELDPDAYRKMGEEITEQIHFKPGEFHRVQTVRVKYARIDSPATPPLIAPLPPALQERCIASPSLVSEIIYNRFALHLPYYRQAEMFSGLGVDFHRKTLCDWALLGADWLQIIHREIQYEHWRSSYRQLDETPIRYLEPGAGKARTGYLWVSNIPGGSVFFHWHEGRDAAGLDALFGDEPDDTRILSEEEVSDISRVIQCDGYQVYRSRVEKCPWVELMACHAHVRRKFFEASEQAPRLVAWILHQFALLYCIETRLRETKAGPALRQAVRAAESRMIHKRLHEVILRLSARDRILPRSNLGKAIAYALKQWPNLELYLEQGRIEIDNNLVENAIRPTKLGQKNWLFVGNGHSGTKCAVLYTIIENCRRLKIDIREYLTDVLTRLPSMKAKEAASLTPAAWHAARTGKTRPEEVAA